MRAGLRSKNNETGLLQSLAPAYLFINARVRRNWLRFFVLVEGPFRRLWLRSRELRFVWKFISLGLA